MRLGLSARCAAQQYQAANVRFGSEADILGGLPNVRFTLKSGHWNSVVRCPLCANSGLMAPQQIRSLFDHFVGAAKQRNWDGETERLRGPDVEPLLHRTAARLI